MLSEKYAINTTKISNIKQFITKKIKLKLQCNEFFYFQKRQKNQIEFFVEIKINM